MWYVYILETKDGRLYTGATNDIPRRMAEHKDGKGGRFTRSFRFKRLVYTEEHPTKSAALKREKQVQGWTRREKLALIKDDSNQPKAF
ncbi:MAG: GIY-YIG nuclease family protein [Candidatus Omnitrophica bacterium]|nr:GIY-YIG nuclease family protein [Candidatus Omnitrophota bacterium]